jgi:hypothetical protein
MKRKLFIVIILGLLSSLAVIWFWIFGWSTGSSIVGNIKRIQYFESPSLVAIHLDSPAGVFVVPVILGLNKEDFAVWLNPANVELKSVDIMADSISEKWSNQFEEYDHLQFGIHGLPRGQTMPNYGSDVSMGIGGERFPFQSFQFMTENEFLKLPVGKIINDSSVYGRFVFLKHTHISLRKKPFIIP